MLVIKKIHFLKKVYTEGCSGAEKGNDMMPEIFCRILQQKERKGKRSEGRRKKERKKNQVWPHLDNVESG